MKLTSKILVFTVILMLIFTLTACSGVKEEEVTKEEDNSIQGEQEGGFVTITGLKESEIKITIKELKSIESVTRDVVSVNSSGEEKKIKVTGGLLDDVLKKYNTSRKELKGIRLTAGDGYSIEVPEDILKNREIILAYAINDQPLDDKSRPVRVIIPEERAMYWVRNLVKIEVLKDKKKTETTKLYIFETAITQIPSYDYTYYDSQDKAIKCQELINSFKTEVESDTIFIKATDRFEKNEKKDIFTKSYIKFTGKDAPVFLSPDIPKGMYVKNILWFSAGENAFLSVENAFNVMEHKVVDDKEGIPLKKVFQEVGLAEGNSYIFTAVDGYNVEINAKDIEKGILYKRTKGGIAVCFDGLPKNTKVKDLLSIQVVK